MAFDPTFMPVNWLYEWYAGFTAALQTEVNKEYGYETYDDFKAEWGTFDIDGADVMNGALATFTGSSLAGKSIIAKPITVDTDDGPRAVIATGQMITAATSEAVRIKIDGFMTSIPWDTVVAEVMMANNYQIQPNKLTELTCKIASQITGQVITDTSNLFVTGKVALDQNGVARSYVDDYVISGLLDGAAAADLLSNTKLEDYEIDEVVPAPTAPDGGQLSVLLWQSFTTGVFIIPPEWSSYDFASLTTQANLMTAAAMILSHWDLTRPAWFNVNSHAQIAGGEPVFVISVNRIEDEAIQAIKYTAHGVSGNVNAVAVQPVNSTDWYTTTSYVPHSSNYSIMIDADGVHAMSPVVTNFYSGYGFASSTGSGTYTINTATASNILSQMVVAPEIDIHDIDIWAPTADAHAIDDLWPGWMEGARVGARAIDADSEVWFPTRDVPLGIDQTDVLNPGQTIAKPLDVAQAGAIAGAEAGAITITDTIADTITIPSILNPAIAIPATVAPTPTPTPVIPVLPPSISAQRLYTVHKVSQQELDTLGAYLWSSDFISLIEHMFTEPIDAVIGLHTLFYGGSLPTGQSGHQIKLGAINATGCTGTLITNQFMKFQCGSVNIPEYWNNANDYAPYTEAEIFLPFIGFRDLDINEIMGGSVSLSYGIDIFTGACVAMIGVMRDHISQALYTFEGNCAIQQPVTGADYSRIIGGLISAGMGIATGGAGAVIGTAAALSSHKISYGRSGNISANAGACMPKQPYILIKRPNAYDAPNYRSFYGDPANWTVTLGSCSGYTRVKDAHLDQIACTDVEKEEILSMLKAGVIL